MVVPVVVVNLHEADALFDELAGHECGVGEGAGLLHVRAVHVERLRGFLVQVDEVRHARLHPVSHLVLLNAGVRFGVADLRERHLVELFQAIERFPANVRRHARRVVDEQNRVALGAERHARMFARQEARLPQPRGNRLHLLLVRWHRYHHHERRHVLVQGAEAVAHPRAEARLARHLVAGLHERDRGFVIDRFGVHRTDDAHVVDHLRFPGEHLGKPRAALAVLGEFEDRRRDREARLPRCHRRQALAVADRFGQVFVVPVLHLRLGVEEVHLCGAADHVQIDDVLALRGKVRLGERGIEARCRAADFRRGRRRANGRQRRRTEAETRRRKELTPRLTRDVFAERRFVGKSTIERVHGGDLRRIIVRFAVGHPTNNQFM